MQHPVKMDRRYAYPCIEPGNKGSPVAPQGAGHPAYLFLLVVACIHQSIFYDWMKSYNHRRLFYAPFSAKSFATANPSHCADIGESFAQLTPPIFLSLVFTVDLFLNIECGFLVIFDFLHTAPPYQFTDQSPSRPARNEVKTSVLHDHLLQTG